MASSGSGHLKDIDEQFCQCPICLQQYQEPKLLPCLHRYCSDCLEKLIKRNQGVNVIHCPQCRDEFTIPEDGVAGFKTDFYMKNIIEYIQIQKPLEEELCQKCHGCLQMLQVTAYCFKCKGFLCKDCYNIHLTNNIIRDHKKHALSLEDLKSKDLTPEKLADLREAPRCESHPEDLCRLCCRSCDNLPICMTCTYGNHKNHDINEVRIVAAEKKKKLKQELENLDQYREKIVKLPEMVHKAGGALFSNVGDQKENNTKRYENNIKIVKKEIKKIEENYRLRKSEIEEEEKTKLMENNKEMEEEIKQVRIKYDIICDEIKGKSKITLANLKQKQEQELQISREKLAILENDFQTFIKTLETKQKDGLAKLQEIAKQIDDVTERYKNLTTTGYSVLETSNYWTAVQCEPVICKAIEPLSADLKREFPELDTLPKIAVIPEITEDEKSPVNIEEIKTKGWKITGVISCGDRSIVITGIASKDSKSCHVTGHVTVINIEGRVSRKMEVHQTLEWHYHCFTYLSNLKVAVVTDKTEIGIFDVRDASCFKKNISNATSSWPVDRGIFCLATDPVNNHILVGGSCKGDVYVFDDQLNYHHTLTLPEIIKWPRDMIIIGENLLVCDSSGQGAYIVSMERQGKVIQELVKPNLDGDDWRPLSVCNDRNGFIYILWATGKCYNRGKRVLTQYTPNGYQLLKTVQLDGIDASCVTTVNIGQAEKLLVAGWGSGKLYIYNLT